MLTPTILRYNTRCVYIITCHGIQNNMFNTSFPSSLRSCRYLNSGDHAKRILNAVIRRLIDYRVALIDPFL